MEFITLRNGLVMPMVGLGTWNLRERPLLIEIVQNAYKEGYRFIDTASAYCNEISLSKAMMNIPREDMFIADKVCNTSRGYEPVRKALKTSLGKLKMDYCDLYLVHWPASPKIYENWAEVNADTWKGMESLYKEGLAKSIGVCNFKIHHLEELKKTAEIFPFVNQIEIHPGMNQHELLEYCASENIKVIASSPLGNGQILENEELAEIALEYGVSVSQICLRWAIQKGVAVVPKTSKVQRLKENIDIFSFELSDSDMSRIDAIPYCGGIGIDSDEVVEFG